MDINKTDRAEIFELVKSLFVGKPASFEGGPNPFVLTYKGEKYNVYIKNLTPAQLANNNPNVWRLQLPKRVVFDKIKSSSYLFLLLGYDGDRQVFATWNPYWAKQRLNVGSSVSLYSRLSCQEKVSKSGEFIVKELNKQGIVVIFPINRLAEYIERIKEFFPEETTYVPIGSSLRNKEKENLTLEDNTDLDEQESSNRNNQQIIMEKEFDKLSLLTPEIIEELTPIMNQEEPNFLIAISILSNHYGEEYNDCMKLQDWKQLLMQVDWKKSSNNSTKIKQPVQTSNDPSISDSVKEQFRNYLIQQGLSINSINRYVNQVAASADVRAIISEITGTSNLYCVTDINLINRIKEKVRVLPINIRGNGMYYSGINKYAGFLNAKLTNNSKESSESPKQTSETQPKQNEEETDNSFLGIIKSFVDKIGF